MEALQPIVEAAWLYVAAPVLALAGLWLTIRLRGVQLTRLAAGFRALRARDTDAEGEITPASSTWLATAGAMGAAATVGAATAVALGGAGVLLWVWIFGLLLAPLRYAEVLLARTDAPGRSEAAESGSLAGRLVREGGAGRILGYALAALVVLSAFAFVGGVHGGALADASAQLLPDSVPVVGLGVAAIAAILAGAGLARGGNVAGWVALASLSVLLLVGLWAAASDPGRALGALARGLTEAFEGAPAATPFVGAFAGEIVVGALLYALPPVGAASGVVGGVHSAAQARTTRGQAAAAMVGPLVYAVLTTVLCAAFVATGAYWRRVEDRRPVDEVRVYTVAFETASQRAETDRLYDGYLRIEEGRLRDIGPLAGTAQGMIDEPRWLHRGEPANMALHLRDGLPFRILLAEEGVLREAPTSELREVEVAGEMLPRGGGLLAVALGRGTGGEIGPRLALGALLLLLAVGGAAWGLAASRSLGRRAPPWARIAVSLLPAAGLALAATGAAPWLGPVGGLVAAAAVTLAALALLWKSGETAGLGG